MEDFLALSHPRITSFAKSNTISVQEVMQASNLDDIFMLPLSQQDLDELNHLQEIIHNVPYNENVKDVWHLTWGPSYTSKKFYSHIYSMLEAHPVYRMIWKSNCTPKIKFFIWLILVDRLNTKTVLTRRHIAVHDDDICVMCHTGATETIEHLLFLCPFARQCWMTLNFVWDISLNIEDRLARVREANGQEFFVEAAMIATRELWKIRDDKVFERQNPSHAGWVCNFKKQGLLQSLRFKADLRSTFCFWLDAFS